MPKYVYKCTECDNVKEVIIKSADNVDKLFLVCNKCSSPLKRDYSAEKSNFILKGEKWASKKGY
jgi:putative FmdB family regulatory protein